MADVWKSFRNDAMKQSFDPGPTDTNRLILRTLLHIGDTLKRIEEKLERERTDG